MIPFKSHSLSAVPKTLGVRLEIMKAIHTLAAQDDVRKFDPNQPRLSAGNPDGGQWTSDGGRPAENAGVNEILERAKNWQPVVLV